MKTLLRITNVTDTAASVQVFIGGTEMPGSPFPLGAGASTSKSYIGIDKGPVQIVSTQNIVASEQVVYRVGGIPTSLSEMMAFPKKLLTKEYWLPWYNNETQGTQLRIGNASGIAGSVQVFIGGQEMAGSPFPLAASASLRLNFAGLDKGPVKIVSDVDIVASERVLYSVDGVEVSFSEMMALPGNLLHFSNWLPYYNNKDLNTQLRFATP